MDKDNIINIKKLIDGWRQAELSEADEERLRSMARIAVRDPETLIRIAGTIGEEYSEDLHLIDSIDVWAYRENAVLPVMSAGFQEEMESYIHTLSVEEKRKAFRGLRRRVVMWGAASFAAVACSLGVYLSFESGAGNSSYMADVVEIKENRADTEPNVDSPDTEEYESEQILTADPERKMRRIAVSPVTKKEKTERHISQAGGRRRFGTSTEVTPNATSHSEAVRREYIREMREVDEAISAMLGSHLAYVREEMVETIPEEKLTAWADTGTADGCSTIECALEEGMAQMADASREMFLDLGSSLREMKLDSETSEAN